MGKKGSGGRSVNPTDAFRKAERDKEKKKNKRERTKIREETLCKKDPSLIQDELKSLKRKDQLGQLDHSSRKRLQQLEGMWGRLQSEIAEREEERRRDIEKERKKEDAKNALKQKSDTESSGDDTNSDSSDSDSSDSDDEKSKKPQPKILPTPQRPPTHQLPTHQVPTEEGPPAKKGRWDVPGEEDEQIDPEVAARLAALRGAPANWPPQFGQGVLPPPPPGMFHQHPPMPPFMMQGFPPFPPAFAFPPPPESSFQLPPTLPPTLPHHHPTAPAPSVPKLSVPFPSVPNPTVPLSSVPNLEVAPTAISPTLQPTPDPMAQQQATPAPSQTIPGTTSAPGPKPLFVPTQLRTTRAKPVPRPQSVVPVRAASLAPASRQANKSMIKNSAPPVETPGDVELAFQQFLDEVTDT